MYKRRTKSGGLGIVRTVSKTQQSTSDQSENVSSCLSNWDSSTVPGRKNGSTKSELEDSNRKRQTKTPEPDDSDEVLSDTEPSPKRSRRFINCSTSVLKERTASNNELIEARSPASKIITSTRKELTLSNLQSTIPKLLTPEKKSNKTVKSTNLKPTQESLTNNSNKKRSLKEPADFKSDNNPKSQTRTAHEKLKEDLKKNRKLSYLEEIFEKAGLLLSDGTSSNVLRTDQAVFIRDIRNAICLIEEETKRNVEQIMKDLEEYCNDDKCFKYAISFTETAEDCDVSRGATQDSLMRLLLHVECLQAPVTELLLMDKLAKFVMDSSSGDSSGTTVITWVRMILQCFRFLERMDNGKAVNDQLLEIVLVSADITIQQEVILSLPDIIQDTEHHHTALELSKLVRKSSPELMTSALEALTNLSLQPEVRTQIQPQLLRAINKIPHDYLPTMLKFLFTDGDAAAMDEVITFLRNELELAEISGDSASVQVLVFMTLRDALLVSRTLPALWLKNITSVKTQAEHKPMDIVMLLILLSLTSDQTRQRAIEAVFRSKIRADMFTETLVNETLKSYIPVIKEYFQVTIKLAGALLKSTEPAVVEFASKMYIGMFVNMDGLWCKWVLSDLQQGVGTGDTAMARAALSVIQHLTNNHHHKVKPLGVILMLLLNKLNDLALNEVCQLMDILCHIAYSEEDSSDNCSILQDEINILVQKQLASSQISVKRNGIVGCVMTIKHVTIVPEGTTESCGSEKDETTDKTKKAVQLLELLLSSTKDCKEAQGLALDQLSHLLISGKMLDSAFVSKLSSLMRDKLQDDFLISASDFVSKDDVVKTSLQFYLDDDPEGSIALNLADLVVNECNSAKTKPSVGVSCLHPLLRLLRGLEMSDLSEIDALLGCHICLPVPLVYAEFGLLDAYQQHVALHCLFHCINWLIEIVNCFSYLVKKNEAEKVVVRLRLIVWLRGLLSRCLPLAMEYNPPLCYFQAFPKPKANSSQDKPAKKKTKKKGKKKGKKKQEEDQPLTGTVADTSQLSEEEEEEVAEEKSADLSKYKHYFRELDIDVWLLLTQPLTLSPAPEKGGEFTAELGPSELLYLLDDYVTKLSHSLTSSHKRISFLKTASGQNVVGFENLDKFSPLHVAKNTIKLLSFLCGFLEKTVEFTQNLVKVNDGILDSTGMFMEGSAEIKICQGRLLRILAILFSWVGFQNPANSNFLLAALQKVAGRVSSEQAKSKSRPQLVKDCVQYLTQCHEHVLDLTSACTLVDTIKALLHYAEHENNIKTQIATICGEFLGRRWYDMKGNREKGAVLNSQVGELLSNYLSLSADKLKSVTDILGWLSGEHQLLDDKDGTLTTFPSFSRLNLHVLINGLLKGLESAVKQKLEEHPTDREQLELWSSFTNGMETLVTVVKAHDSKPNLRVFMKGCTTVLKLFLSQGMSTCRFMFKHEPATVSQILKKLQVTTRYIQTICNYVKVSKDTGLTQYLPPIRAALETILLQVRSIIVINNCADAFFMGSMKNRDLKGQEIPSQETHVEDEEEINSLQKGSDSEEDKEKEDDENSIIETDDEEINADQESNSVSI